MLEKLVQVALGKKSAACHYFTMYGDIDDEMALNFTEFVLSNNLCAPEDAPELMVVFINSKGGDLHAAWTIIEMIRGSRVPIALVALGQISSAGLAIFMSGEKGKRLLTENTTIMSHQFYTASEGTYNDLMAQTVEYKYTHSRLLSHYLKCSVLPKEKIEEKLLSQSDSWLTTAEAIKYGVADKVINLK